MANGSGPPTDGAVPLGQGQMLEEAAVRIGLVCPNCGELIEAQEPVQIENYHGSAPMVELGPAAYEYITLRPAMKGGRPGVAVEKDLICTRTQCDAAREEMDRSATAKRPVTNPWTLLPTGPFRRETEEAPDAN